MSLKELKASVALGEDCRRQFKQNVTNADSAATEMAAFANSEGGTIFLGVADDGTLPGLEKSDVARLNQLISNAASQNVTSWTKCVFEISCAMPIIWITQSPSRSCYVCCKTWIWQPMTAC